MTTQAPPLPNAGTWLTEYPFAPNWLDVGEVRMHYVDEGPGAQRAQNAGGSRPNRDWTPNSETTQAQTPANDNPTLLFLHGNPTWSFYWRHLVTHFSKTHRCVAPDHIGCGISDKPEHYPYTLAQHIANARSLVHALDLRDIVLVVHDWGGAIGMGLAAQIADRVRGLVVCNTGAFRSNHMPPSIGLCRIPGFGALAIRGCNAFVRGALRYCARKPLTEAARAGYLAPYTTWRDRVANLRFVQDIPTKPGHPSWETLIDVEQGLEQFKDHPMLLCWGKHDFVFNDKFLQEWQRRFPDARTEYYENAGHFVVEDAREEIINAMEDFLKPMTAGLESQEAAP
jgi:cis-3-alkyl-4-acyloxetan-2-one decarboxylase